MIPSVVARQVQEKHHLTVEVSADPAAEPTDEGIRVFLFQAVRELLSNVAKYAGTDHAWARMTTDGPDTRIEVRDQGRGFDPEGVVDPLAPENRLKTSGRGIFYMRTFMDDVRFQRHAEGGMEIVLKKNLGAVKEKEENPA